jgi:hypothetical protein
MASALFLAPQFLFNWRSGIGRHAIGTGALKLGRIWPSPTKLKVFARGNRAEAAASRSRSTSQSAVMFSLLTASRFAPPRPPTPMTPTSSRSLAPRICRVLVETKGAAKASPAVVCKNPRRFARGIGKSSIEGLENQSGNCCGAIQYRGTVETGQVRMLPLNVRIAFDRKGRPP